MKLPGRPLIDTDKIVLNDIFTVTLAELNAGRTLVPSRQSAQLKVVGFLVIMNGSFTTLTDMRLSSIDPAGLASPTDILTIVQAQMGTGVAHAPGVGTHTRGAGFAAALTKGHGIQVRKTGGTAAGGTDMLVSLYYVIDNG